MNFLFYAPQMAPYGGMERHICTLAAAAAKEGHRVRFLTTSNSLGTELRGLLNSPQITFRELPLCRGSAGVLRKLSWLLNEVRLARHTNWNILYTNGQSGLARFVWWAARKNSRIVHHHHTAADELEQRTWSPAFKRVLTRAPELVGCSQATCYSIRASTGRTKTTFLPYLSRCVLDAADIFDRPAPPSLRFGFLGRLVKEKGLETLISLAQQPSLSDIEWHIHGAGDDFPPSRFQGIPRLHYHGAYRSAQEHRSVLEGLDAVALFSTHNEGMPLSLIETMSAGLPWIATDKGGTKELAKSPQDCVVCPAGLEASNYAPMVRALADRILAGETSRLRQREAYDHFLAPELVSRQWIDYFCHARTEDIRSS